MRTPKDASESCLPILVHNECKIHKLAPDWLEKGAHVTAKGIELKILPGANGSIVFKSVFSSTNKTAVEAAIREARASLGNPKFRAKLYRDLRRAMDYANSNGAGAKSAEFRFLMKALEKY